MEGKDTTKITIKIFTQDDPYTILTIISGNIFFTVLFFGVLFGVLFGRGVVVMCLLGFVSIACRYVSALICMYACEYCFCFVLCICLYAGYVYVCELGGSFAGGCPSLANTHVTVHNVHVKRAYE